MFWLALLTWIYVSQNHSSANSKIFASYRLCGPHWVYFLQLWRGKSAISVLTCNCFNYCGWFLLSGIIHWKTSSELIKWYSTLQVFYGFIVVLEFFFGLFELEHIFGTLVLSFSFNFFIFTDGRFRPILNLGQYKTSKLISVFDDLLRNGGIVILVGFLYRNRRILSRLHYKLITCKLADRFCNGCCFCYLLP